jgi:hypothetical protein
VAAESDRFIRLWEYRYPRATGIPNHPERRNSNTNLYYAYASTRRTGTPAVVAEHGVGAPVGTGGYPPGDDAAYLHGQIDEVAQIVGGLILDYLGVAAPVPIVLPPSPEPEEPMPILDDAQRLAAAEWIWRHVGPFPSEFAIPRAWLDEWRAGRYRGAPLSPEVDLPDGAKLQEFAHGACVWHPSHGTSWES